MLDKVESKKYQLYVEKVKDHFRRNKKVYIACGVTAVAAVGITVYFMSGKGDEIPEDMLLKVKQIGFRNETNLVNIRVEEKSTPSKPLFDPSTKTAYDSLSDAARRRGTSIYAIRKQIADGDLQALDILA